MEARLFAAHDLEHCAGTGFEIVHGYTHKVNYILSDFSYRRIERAPMARRQTGCDTLVSQLPLPRRGSRWQPQCRR